MSEKLLQLYFERLKKDNSNCYMSDKLPQLYFERHKKKKR